MMQESRSTTPTQPGASWTAKMAQANRQLVALWEAVLGSRYRSLPCDRQQGVLAAVGCKGGSSCPLAMAYDLWDVCGQWDQREQATMEPYGVTKQDYIAFLDWHDDPTTNHTAFRAWLKAQQSRGPVAPPES